jgi:DNA ligase D-like protein (predicted ligase)
MSWLNKKIRPMLAHSAEPFDSPRHLFEIKWDGTRCIAFISKGARHVRQGESASGTTVPLRLQNRRLLDITYRYPELNVITKPFRGKSAILDGELVVFVKGRPSFQKLQEREHAERPFQIKLLCQYLPATLVAFDIIYLNGRALVTEPLWKRKEILSENFKDERFLPHLIVADYILERGKKYFREASRFGFEGVMAKALQSPYLIGQRSRWWLKIKARLSARCHICGYLKTRGRKEEPFGSLILGEYKNGDLVYRGRVGSGFTSEDFLSIYERLKSFRQARSPFREIIPFQKEIVWLRPVLECLVKYQEETPHGRFRAPIFQGLVDM